MANTRFQAKRTSTSGLLPNTTNSGNLSYIAAGEFAVNLTDKKVLSSNGTLTFEVGANLSSLTVTTIVANGSTGNASQVLSSNGTGVYWAAGGTANAATMNTYTFTITSNTTTITGADDTANTLVYTAGLESVFINGSRQIAGVDYNTTNTTVLTLTSNAIAGEVVQVTTLNASITSGGGTVGGSNTQVTFNDSGSANGSANFTFNKTTTTLALGSNVTVNTSAIFLGNSTVNTTIIAGNVNLQGTQLKVGNVVVNGNQLLIGNVTITDTQITVGNSTVNSVLSSTGSLSAKTLTAGNTSITGFANVSTSVNAASHTVGTSFIANSTGITTTGFANVSTTLRVGGVTTFSGNVVLGSVGVSANGGFGTAGQVLSSNGTAAYWATAAGGGGGVTTFDGGSTGLTPSSASNGAVSLGGTLNVGYGGTGTSTYPSNGQLLIGTSGGGYAVANLTAGSGVSITKGSGTITIAATGGGGGGPYIAFFQFEPSSGNYIGNGPTSPTQQSPVVYWDSGLNQASLWWYYPTGGVSNNGVSINGGITVQDSTGTYTNYTSGTDFSSSISNWYGSGNVIGIYGLGVTNVTLRALMANTASQLGSPAIAPRGTNMFGSQSTIYASVSGGINSSYYSGGRPIIVRPGFSNGYYGIYFNSGSPTSDSFSLSYLTIDNNLGTGSYTYYAGTDFSVSSASNDSNQQFQCQIYSVSNTTLSTLLDNTIIN